VERESEGNPRHLLGEKYTIGVLHVIIGQKAAGEGPRAEAEWERTVERQAQRRPLCTNIANYTIGKD